MKQYDAIVVGAGVVGAAVARELSRRKGSFLVVERALDVCEGTSKANSAIVHAGFDAEPGTWKAKMNVAGNQSMDALSQELDIPFRRVGAFVVCFAKEELPKLRELYDRGVANGVPDMELLTGEQARALEPNLSEEVQGALLAKTSGIVCPFELTLGLAESAAKNGVEFSFDTQVTGLERAGEGWVVHTSQGDFAARAVVNAAGVFADEIHNWVCEDKLHITPRRGEYCLLDHTAGGHASRTVFQLPGKYGKGVLVSPTVHGNLLLGPTAKDIGGKEDTATTAPGLQEVLEKSALGVKNIPARQVITSFCRAARPRGRGRLRPGGERSRLLRRRGHRVPGPFQRPGHRGVPGGAHRGEAGPAGKPGLRPHPPGRAPCEGPACGGAGSPPPEGPGLRADCLPVRGGVLRGNPGRHPRHFGGQDPGRRQAPHPGRHGPVPGGVLLPPGDGPAQPGAGPGFDGHPQKRQRSPNCAGKDPWGGVSHEA